MAYYMLTEDKVAEYVRGVPELKAVLGSLESLEVKEIGDGNLNYVYIVKNKADPARSVILKQAVPFLRCVGEEWPLPKERMRFEIAALQKENELCPGLVPAIYHASDEMCLVVMQNLDRHKVVRGEIINGKKFPRLAKDLGEFLGRTLFLTSDYYLDHRTKKLEVAKFINVDLCKITEDFVLTNPFEASDTNKYNPSLDRRHVDAVQKDPAVKAAAAEMKYAFMTKAEALLHGDFHLGSYMANEDETFVIDPEFAFYGPIGFDVGKTVSNLLLAYISQDYRRRAAKEDPVPFRAWLLDQTATAWNVFEETFLALWEEHRDRHDAIYWAYEGGDEHAAAYRKLAMERIFSDSLGFAGCSMIRRTLGLAKVADIAGIEDLEARAECDRQALEIGKRLLVERGTIRSIDEVIGIAKAVSPLR